MNPTNWSNEEWDDYEDYLMSLSKEEFDIEIKMLESLGEAKKSGKNLVVNESFYIM